MRFHSALFFGVVSLLAGSSLAVIPGSARAAQAPAQSSTPAGVPPPAATSAQPAAPTSASVDNPTPPVPPQTQAAPLPNAKPATKVWTNEDIATAHGKPGVPPTANHAPQKVSATSKTYAQDKDPAWYRRQLAPLRDEIDKLDPQIAKFKAFLSGEIISDPPTVHRQMVPTPQEQLNKMETKRATDETKIEDLLDRARHNGIEPGALR
jgi:hypothetical protein